MSGSPKRKNQVCDQFVNRCNVDDLTVKEITVVKVSTNQRAKALVGTNPVVPLNEKQV
jgi:hypothetical protein